MKTYLITGASRGIGYDTARILADQSDCRVLALARSEDRLRNLCALPVAGQLEYLVYDLATGPSPEFGQWIRKYGPIQGLINNAGLLINKPFEDLQPQDWQRVFQVNFFGPVQLLHALLPHFDPAGAHVVNIGSMGGFQGSSKFPGLSAYSAAKAALSNLAECLAEEWKDRPISVNCLALGAVQTEMLSEAFPGYQPPTDSATVARFVAYFLEQGHHFFNGKVLPVALTTP